MARIADMMNVQGVWLPDHEAHLQQFAKGQGWTYQKHKLDSAVGYCNRRKLAIDVGGHCGLWSRHLVGMFTEVVAFEPVAEHRECYLLNVQADNYTLHPVALGDHQGSVSIHTTEGSSGDSWVDGEGIIPMMMLDDYLLEPDFIKIDCEGYEKFVLLGGEATVRKHKPIVVVEQKPGKAKNFGLRDVEAVELLMKWGYKIEQVLSGDYICKAS